MPSKARQDTRNDIAVSEQDKAQAESWKPSERRTCLSEPCPTEVRGASEVSEDVPRTSC